MNWPDWFGRRAKAELKNWQDVAYERQLFINELQEGIKQRHQALQEKNETNLRLISDLRQMDQWTYSLVQAAPNWPQMQPTVAKMNEVVEKRMAIENNRIRNLVVGEIVTAYNEPKKYIGRHEGVSIFEVPSIEDKSK